MQTRFVTSDKFIDEVELDVVPLDACGVVFGSPYMYMWYDISMQITNKYFLMKDGKSFIINAHYRNPIILLVSVNQANKLINSNKKYDLMLLRES